MAEEIKLGDIIEESLSKEHSRSLLRQYLNPSLGGFEGAKPIALSDAYMLAISEAISFNVRLAVDTLVEDRVVPSEFKSEPTYYERLVRERFSKAFRANGQGRIEVEKSLQRGGLLVEDWDLFETILEEEVAASIFNRVPTDVDATDYLTRAEKDPAQALRGSVLKIDDRISKQLHLDSGTPGETILEWSAEAVAKSIKECRNSHSADVEEDMSLVVDLSDSLAKMQIYGEETELACALQGITGASLAEVTDSIAARAASMITTDHSLKDPLAVDDIPAKTMNEAYAMAPA